jgi:hypothetical protein
MRLATVFISAIALVFSTSFVRARLQQPDNRYEFIKAKGAACGNGDPRTFCRLAEIRSQWPELRRWRW